MDESPSHSISAKDMAIGTASMFNDEKDQLEFTQTLESLVLESLNGLEKQMKGLNTVITTEESISTLER